MQGQALITSSHPSTCILRHVLRSVSSQPARSLPRQALQILASSGMVHATASTAPPLRFRPNVGICLVNRDGLVFAAQRSGNMNNGDWQMPQGGIDEGEDAEAAAVRELFEETSIRSAHTVGSMAGWLKYTFPTHVRAQLHGGWDKFDGQAQRWFLLAFTGSDEEINLETEQKEFDAWRWMPLEEMPRSVVEFKQEVYTQVASEFGPLIAELKRTGQLGPQSAL